MAHGVGKHQLLVIGPTEPWSVREKLCLATSVMKSGDKNWVSVSRAIKPFAEPGRPPDWFSHKHCASKYSELLETAEAPNQKRGNGGEAVETVKDVIVRRLTTDRIDALRKLIKETREKHRKLKREAELIQAGCLDSKLEELWGDILQKKKVEEKETELKRKSTNAAYRARQVAKPHNSQAQRGIPARSPPGCSPPGQVFSPGDPLEGLTLDLESMKNPSGLAGPTATAESSGPGSDDVSPGSLRNDPAQWNVSSQKATPPPSPLLSELLKKGSIMATHSRLIGEGDVTTANITGAPDLRLAPTSQPLTQATGAPMLSRLLEAGPAWFSAPLGFVVVADSASGAPPPAAAPLSVHSSAASANTERSSPSGCRPVPPEDKGDVTVSYVGGELDPKTVGDIIAIIEDKTDKTAEALDAAAVEAALSLCEEDGRALPGAWGPGPFQPNGSLEAAPTGPRGLPRTSSSSKASQQQDAPHGDSVLEDSPLAPRRRKEVRTEDGRSLHAASSSSSTRPRAAADSASSSPASSQLSTRTRVPLLCSSVCSEDHESLRAHKIWKKAIMLVWRAAANHRYANVFLQPVTDEIAPGYHGIVQRPTDLAAIKKSIETGSIRNTAEFQRDVMLMFQNAVMYNSLDHDVHHMALEMQRDVLEQIQQFLATQLIMEASESDPSKQDVPDKVLH